MENYKIAKYLRRTIFLTFGALIGFFTNIIPVISLLLAPLLGFAFYKAGIRFVSLKRINNRMEIIWPTAIGIIIGATPIVILYAKIINLNLLIVIIFIISGPILFLLGVGAAYLFNKPKINEQEQ